MKRFRIDGKTYGTIFENDLIVLGGDRRGSTRLVRKNDPRLVEIRPIAAVGAPDLGRAVRVLEEGVDYGRIAVLADYLDGNPGIGPNHAFVDFRTGIQKSVPLENLEWVE